MQKVRANAYDMVINGVEADVTLLQTASVALWYGPGGWWLRQDSRGLDWQEHAQLRGFCWGSLL